MFNLKSYMLKISVLDFEIFINFAAKNLKFFDLSNLAFTNVANEKNIFFFMKMVQLVALLRHQSRSESGSYVEKYCGLDDTDYPRK